MLLKKFRINLLMILIPLVGIFVASLLYATVTWGKYGTTLELDQHIKKSEILGTLLKSLSSEMICAAKMSNDLKNLAKECQNYRNQTDIALEKITAYDNTIPIPQQVKNLFIDTASKKADISIFQEKNLRKNLQDIRDKMDSGFQLPIDKLLSGEYQHQLIIPIQSYLEKSNLYGYSEDKPYLSLDSLLFKYRLDSLYDTIFGTYFLANNQMFSSENFSLWDSYATLSALPELNELKNIPMVKESLFGVFASKQTQLIVDKVDNMRIDMLLSRDGGNSETTMEEWLSYNDKKHKLYDNAQSETLGYLNTKTLNDIRRSEIMLMVSIPVALLSLVLFLLFLKKYFERLRRENEALKIVLADIATLTSETQKEVATSAEILRDFSDKENIYKYIGSILTLLRLKEQQADEANGAKDLFLANMSHEIRTPLNGIVGFTQLLKETNMSDDQHEFVNIIENSSDNLLAIVSDILDLSKINAHKMEFEHIGFDIFEKVESAVETFSAKADEKEIELSVAIDPTLPKHFMGDPTKLSQVLINLMGNAIKFTPHNGNISLSVDKIDTDEEYCKIRFGVKDSGIGISEEQKEKIFQAFTQADSSTSREFGGTGLGLTISSSIVAHMGGKLDVLSSPNEGAEFYFEVKLEMSSATKSTPYPQYNELTVGLALHDIQVKRTSDEVLHRYLTHLDIKPKLYSIGSILGSFDSMDLPEILFVNHADIKDNVTLQRLLALDTHIVLMSTGALKRKLENQDLASLKVVYKPMTMSKTVRMVENYHKPHLNEAAIDNKKLSTKQFSHIHALVAEDNLINQKLIKVTLENFGMTVTLASNGQEVYEARTAGQYDIIFMDIQMPIMNGIEATEAILGYEADNGIEHIPIIALTANALKGDKEKYLQAGMDGYASKPLNLLELRAIVAELFLSGEKKGKSQPQPQPHKQAPLASKAPISHSRNVDETIIIQPTVDILLPKATHESKKDFEHKKTTKSKKHHKEKKNKKSSAILLYNQIPLQSNVYSSIFSGLGYSVDVVQNGDQFLDKLENNPYAYAAFDCDCFEGMPCMIADIIRKSDSIPIVFVKSKTLSEDFCSQIVEKKADLETIKNKLESAW